MKNIQLQKTFTHSSEESAKKRNAVFGKEYTEKTSFKTLESAIKEAEKFIYKKEAWIDVNMVKAIIINKETNEVLWSWER